jgi:hypothetical protein
MQVLVARKCFPTLPVKSRQARLMGDPEHLLRIDGKVVDEPESRRSIRKVGYAGGLTIDPEKAIPAPSPDEIAVKGQSLEIAGRAQQIPPGRSFLFRLPIT